MRLFRYSPDIDNAVGLYKLCPLEEWQTIRVRLIAGEHLAKDWKALQCEWSHENIAYRRDFPPIDAALCVFSERAVRTLAPLLGESVEYLSLDVAGGGVTLVNILNVIDCLDEEKSEVYRLPNGQPLLVSNYQFRSLDVPALHMFRIPQTRGTEVIVSDQFCSAIQSAGLTGYEFEPPVWESNP